VARAIEGFRSRGCGVLVVTQATPAVLGQFLRKNSLPFPIVGDPERRAYRAFGLERASWGTFFQPRVLWGYLRLMIRGTRLRTPYAGEDVRQLGGDFLLDRAGEVAYAFRRRDPTARPEVSELFAAIDRLAPDAILRY